MSRPNFDMILATVAAWSGIDPGELCGGNRHGDTVLARGLLIVAAHQYAGMSYPEIRNAMAERRPATLPKLAERTRRNPRHSTALTSDHRTRRVLLEAERQLANWIAEREQRAAAGGVA